jgi:hypothetical protein
MDELKSVTLVCGTCGGTKNIWASEWANWKKRRDESGTVMLCSKPSTIPGAKKGRKCEGVMMEESEDPFHKAEPR